MKPSARQSRAPEPSRQVRSGGASPTQAALMVVALAACAVTLSLFQIASHDTWLHLAIGRHVLATGSIPDADPFSHTVPGAPWTPHEWLSGVILYLVGLGGTSLLILLRVAMVLSFLAGWLMLCRRRPGALWGVALLAPFVFTFGPRFLIRPFLFSSALVIWQMVLVDTALRTRRLRLLCLLPPLYVLWINLHSAAVVGWAYLVIFTAGLALQARLARRESWRELADLRSEADARAVRTLALWVALAGAAMVINPNGLRAVLYPLGLFHGWVQRASVEHQSTIAHLASLGGGKNRLVLFALVVMATWAVALGRMNLGATALMLLVTGLAIWRIRNTVDFGLLAVALIGPAFGEVIAGALRRLSPSRVVGVGRLMTALLIAVALACAVICFPRSDHHRFGFGVDQTRCPTAALEFLERHLPPEGEGFHPMEWGGAILWFLGGQEDPADGVRVFVDGRLLVYGYDFLANDYRRIALGNMQDPTWLDLLDRHGVSWILLDRANRDFTPLVRALYRRQESPTPDERDWGLVWFDDTALIFFRADAFPPEQWQGMALGFQADPAWVREQPAMLIRSHPEWREKLVAMIEENPANRSAVELLLAMEEIAGTEEHHIEALERMLTFDLTDSLRADTEHALGVALLRAGEAEAAAEHLERAARIAPDSAAIQLSLASALWTLRREDETVAAYRRVLELDPESIEAREALEEHAQGRLWAEHPSAVTP
ncbi:tetratricopeptide repeat protein [Candidatus Sumerlaeota bacterium]|nr:tetratricopeptide repeat protein [Candidatus Sumerlaeota bacterium]